MKLEPIFKKSIGTQLSLQICPLIFIIKFDAKTTLT